MSAITQSIGGERSVHVPPSPLSAVPSLLRGLVERQRPPNSLLSLSQRRRRNIKKTGEVEDKVDEGIIQMARVSGPSCALAAGALWRIDHNIEGNVPINFLITQLMNKSVEESNLGITVFTVSTRSRIVYKQVWRSC